jgi:membrane protein
MANIGLRIAGRLGIKNQAPKWRVFLQAVTAFLENDLSTSAAAISYYWMLMLFPLLILIVSAGQAIVGAQEVREFLLNQVLAYLPGTRTFVRENLERVEHFGAAGVLSLVVLVFWATSWIFTVIEKALSRIFLTPARSFLKGRLLTTGMVGAFALMMVGSSLVTAGVAVVERASERFNVRRSASADLLLDVAFQVVLVVTSIVITVGLLALIYKLMPNLKVLWVEVLPGAVLAGTAWELMKYAFAYVMPSLLEEYKILYGGIWLALVLMTWTYMSSIVMLFGAQLTALLHFEHVFERSEVSGGANGSRERASGLEA